MSRSLAILSCAMFEYAMEHLGELVGFVVRYNVMDAVEPASHSQRLLESMVNTAGGNFSCRLWSPVVQALRSGE